jgi:hypothetical protein
VNLKFIEVGVLLVAGVLFVAWQFRDLRRAKETTRLKRKAEKQSLQCDAKTSTTPVTPPSKND